jgi:threonyl-tRNA synthetase
MMLIVGEAEEKSDQISLRKRKEGDVGKYDLEEFIKYFSGEVDKSLENVQ